MDESVRLAGACVLDVEGEAEGAPALTWRPGAIDVIRDALARDVGDTHNQSSAVEGLLRLAVVLRRRGADALADDLAAVIRSVPEAFAVVQGGPARSAASTECGLFSGTKIARHPSAPREPWTPFRPGRYGCRF